MHFNLSKLMIFSELLITAFLSYEIAQRCGYQQLTLLFKLIELKNLNSTSFVASSYKYYVLKSYMVARRHISYIKYDPQITKMF